MMQNGSTPVGGYPFNTNEPDIKSIKTVGVLEINAKLNQQDATVIIDTGACVSCIDMKLVENSFGGRISPVQGVNMKTATEEPVKIVGRTEIRLEIRNCLLRFPVFVANGLGGCCILGNDFHLRFGTDISFKDRTVRFTTTSGRTITTPFQSREREAKYLRPPPDASWLSQIQIGERKENKVNVISADSIAIPPRSQRMLKITYEGDLPNQGVIEPLCKLFEEKSVILPMGLTTNSSPQNVMVVNFSKDVKHVHEGEVIGEVFEVDEVRTEGPQEISHNHTGQNILRFDENMLNINPELQPTEREALVELLREHSDTFAWEKSQVGRTNMGEQTIELSDDMPVHQPPYRVSHREREIIRCQVEEMVQQDVIRPSRSAYASPVVLVKKKNGEWRFCVDYRKLNSKVVSDLYPLPLIADILTYLNGCAWFTTLDLAAGYWQIPIRDGDKHKTAFVTPDGLWEFQVMPFGLKTSPAVFQRCMDQVLAGLKWGSCLVYLDDLLIMGTKFDEMLERLRSVLKRLRAAKMTLNPTKCQFGYNEIKILGHTVNAQGVSPDASKIDAVRNFEPPRRVRAVRAFLGLCYYYRRFVPDFSQLARPLTLLTKKDVKFYWGPEQQEAFESLKEKLISAPILRHFDPELPLELHTDASDHGVGCALMQVDGDSVMPVAYGSRRLSEAEKKYTTSEKECIAAVWATQLFRQFVWGRKFTIVVDHHALCWLEKNKDSSGRLARWALKLMEFDYTIRHKQGRLHVVPDYLSRSPCQDCGPEEEVATNDIPTLTLSIQDISKLQQEDEECNRILEAVRNPEQANNADRRLARSFIVEQGVLYRRNVAHMGSSKLLVVPQNLKNEILFECHDSPLTGGHLGFTKTFSKIKSRYYWPRMLKDTEQYVKTCRDCQTRKTPKNVPAGLLQPIPVGQMFDRVGIDMLGPFTRTSRGKKYIIVAMDYATKWVEAEAVRTATAEEVAKFLINKVICKFGCIKEIHSDRGTNFKSTVVSELLKGLGIHTSYTTAYHPQCNGLVERFNGTLAQMLSYYVSTNQKDWDLYVNLTCFSYNTSIHETTRHTPFYLLYGREARLPSEVTLSQSCSEETVEQLLKRVQQCREDVRRTIVKAQEKQKRQYDRRHRQVEYEAGDEVMVWTPIRKKGKSTKLLHRWHGPYVVHKKLSDLNYEIMIVPSANRMAYYDIVHVSRLKKFHPRR